MAKQYIRPADQEQQRKTFEERLKMYDNDWDDLLDDELRKQFVPETYANVKLLRDTSLNIFRRIVREICTVYKQPSKRIVGENPKKQTARWDDVVTMLKLDIIMNRAHRISKACTISFLNVRAVPETDKLRIAIIAPNTAYVETEPYDPTEMAKFAYFVKKRDKNNKEIEVWIYYDREQRLYLKTDGTKYENNPFSDETIDETNKYKMIPVVPFPAEYQVRNFFDPNWNKDSYSANLIIGVMNTFLNFLVKTQSFKQIVLTGDDVAEAVKSSILDPLFPLILQGETASASLLDLNTRLDAVELVIRGKVMAICNNYGISNENFTLSGSPQSGFSLRVANQALEEIREADIPLCRDVEKQLYDVIAHVNNVEFGKNIPEGQSLYFNPGEVEFPESWEEESNRWDFEFKHQISNPVDYLIRKDPQMAREDALKRLDEIREENSRIRPSANILEGLFHEEEEGE